MKSYRNRLWRIRIVEALLVSLANLGLAYIVLYLSDRLWDTPSFLLLAIFLLSFVSVIVFSPYWLTKWVLLKKTPLQLSKLLEPNLPAIGDKLTGVIELSADTRGQGGTSETLRQAAIRQVSEDIARLDLNEYIPHPRHRLYLAVLAVIAAVIVALGILTPEASSNAFERWKSPGSPPARFTFAQLEPVGDTLIVPMGEVSTTRFILAESTQRTPRLATYRFDDGVWHDADLSPDPSGYEVSIPAFQKDVPFRFKAGDADIELTIVPKPRPALQRATADVTLPDYTGQSARQFPVRAGVVSALKGSSVRLKAISTQDIAEVHTGDGSARPGIHGQEVTFPEATVGDNEQNVTFSWKDTNGLASHREMTIRIEPVADQVPYARLEIKSDDKFLLPKTSIEFSLHANDDYGLAELGLEWAGESPPEQAAEGTAGERAAPPTGEIMLKEGNRTATNLNATFIFQAEEQQIKPQKITVRAFTRDYFPGRERTYSEPVTLYVVSHEEHAEMVKRELERLVSGIEDIIRDMDSMTDDMEQLLKQPGNELKNRDSKEKLEQLATDEYGNIERLKELKEDGENLFKSASRNEQIDPEAMKKLMQALQGMDSTANGKMEQARQSLDQASKQEDDQRNKMDGALEEHKEAADQLRQISSQLSESSQKMEAATFAARLKLAARQEASIIQSLVSGINDIAGLTPKQLSSRQARELDDINTRQTSTMKLVRWIVDELNHYKDRNVEPVYTSLYKEMTDHSIVEKLESINEKLKLSHVGTSVELASASFELLKKWAALLDDNRAQGGGGGGGGDEDSLSDEDMEFLLKIMRMIQQQQDIRLRTRTVEERKTQPGTSPS